MPMACDSPARADGTRSRVWPSGSPGSRPADPVWNSFPGLGLFLPRPALTRMRPKTLGTGLELSLWDAVLCRSASSASTPHLSEPQARFLNLGRTPSSTRATAWKSLQEAGQGSRGGRLVRLPVTAVLRCLVSVSQKPLSHLFCPSCGG